MTHPVNAERPQERRRRALLATLFLVYLVLLTWVVMWKLEVPQVGGGVRNVKLVPFVAGSNGDGASQPLEVWANLLLFVPFGVYAVLLSPSSRWAVMVAAAATSSTLEAAQYVLAVGRTDVTDVLVNTAGAVVGMALGALANHRLGVRTRRVVPRACALGTALALLACALFAVAPLRHGPPDVVCDSQGSCRVSANLAR